MVEPNDWGGGRVKTGEWRNGITSRIRERSPQAIGGGNFLLSVNAERAVETTVPPYPGGRKAG